MKWSKTIVEYSGNARFENDRPENVEKRSKKKQGKQKPGKLFMFYHFWGGSSKIYFPYKSLAKEGTCIFYDFSHEILTSNVDDTVRNFKIIVKDSLKEIKKRRCDVSIFGSSIGSHVAFKVASESKQVKNLVLNTIGDNFAFNVWNGISTKIIKKNIEGQGINHKQLDKRWRYISPIYSVNKIRNRNILLFTSSLDEVILYSTQRNIMSELENTRRRNSLVVENEPLPHALAVIKNIFKVKKIKEFMLK